MNSTISSVPAVDHCGKCFVIVRIFAGKGKRSIAVRKTPTGTHLPYGITQYYLPLGRGNIPAFTPAEAGTRLSDPGGMQG